MIKDERLKYLIELKNEEIEEQKKIKEEEKLKEKKEKEESIKKEQKEQLEELFGHFAPSFKNYGATEAVSIRPEEFWRVIESLDLDKEYFKVNKVGKIADEKESLAWFIKPGEVRLVRYLFK